MFNKIVFDKIPKLLKNDVRMRVRLVGVGDLIAAECKYQVPFEMSDLNAGWRSKKKNLTPECRNP